MLYTQLKYMKTQDLGFDKENKLLLRFVDNVINRNNFETIKAEFLNLSGVNGSTATSSVPGNWMHFLESFPNKRDLRQQSVCKLFSA